MIVLVKEIVSIMVNVKVIDGIHLKEGEMDKEKVEDHN